MKIILRCLGVALLVAVLAGCGASHGSDSAAADFQLQMYKVPAAQSKTIADKLDGILASPEFLIGTKSHTTMRATTPFPGTLLVLAPASVQPSIATAVAELAKAAGNAGPAKAAKTPESVPLRVQFWLVQAKAGAGDDGAALQALEPTLKQVRAALGASHFVVDDTASAMLDAPTTQTMAAGNGSVVSSRRHKFGFHAVMAADGSVSLEVSFKSTEFGVAAKTIPEVQTSVSVRPGDYVVLAEAPPADVPTNTPNATLMNLLVVRVDRVAAAQH